MALAREQGLDVVAVGALVNRPLTSLIWLQKSGIKGVADLKGKTVATAGIPYQDAFLKTILARVKLTPDDVKAVNVGFGLLPALVGGSRPGDARRLQQRRGRRPARTRQSPGGHPGRPARRPDLRRARPGRPPRSSLEEDPEKFRLFLAALERGTDAAVEAAAAPRPRRSPKPTPTSNRN